LKILGNYKSVFEKMSIMPYFFIEKHNWKKNRKKKRQRL